MLAININWFFGGRILEVNCKPIKQNSSLGIPYNDLLMTTPHDACVRQCYVLLLAFC